MERLHLLHNLLEVGPRLLLTMDYTTLKPRRGRAPPPPPNNPYTLPRQPAFRGLPPKPPGPPPVENQLWTCDQCGTTNYGSATCTNCDAQRPNMNSGKQFAKEVRNIPNSSANVIPNYPIVSRKVANFGGYRNRNRKTKRNLKKSKKTRRKSSRKN